HSFTTPHARRTFSVHQPPPPAIYPLSLHDALPISVVGDELDDLEVLDTQRRRDLRDHRLATQRDREVAARPYHPVDLLDHVYREDRKSTRLNSSHVSISYAVFCLKKKRSKQGHKRG